MSSASFVFLFGMLVLASTVSVAQAEQEVPTELQGIAIDGTLGAKVPLDVPFVDHTGKSVQLRDFFATGRPVVLVLGYYGCPTLCSLVLNGFLDAMRPLAFVLGQQFEAVTLSIDPREKPNLAAAKRSAYLQGLGKPVANRETSWPFLTGEEGAIAQVAQSVGFQYRFDPEGKQWAHAAGVFLLTPDGRLSQILYGIQFSPRDLRLALVEASMGGIGSPLDRLLLWCFHYDPKGKKYSLASIAFIRAAGVVTIMVLGAFLIAAWRKDRRARVNG